MATAAEISEIIKLYVGYYNRAPDPAGLNFWISAFDGGFGLDAMAVDFATQPETLANYPFFLNPSPSVADVGLFVDAVYGNLFNRTPDTAGREFWSTKIASGEFSVGQAISLIIAGATTAPDSDVVANKVAVGRDFFIKANALPAYPFDADDIRTATDIQASVSDSAASVTAAIAQTDEYIADLSRVVVNLTPGVDTAVGGEGNDLFVGVIDAASGDTLQNSDSITGNGGDDALSIRITSLVVNSTPEVRPNTTGVENVEVSNVVIGGQYVVDLGSMNGLTSATLKDDNAAAITAFGNVANGTVFEMNNANGQMLIDFADDQNGAADSVDLTVANSGTANQAAIFGVINIAAAAIDTGIEEMNLMVEGSEESFLSLSGMQLDDLNVSGTGSVTLFDFVDGFSTLESVDASGLTGGLEIFAGDVAGPAFSFMGGSGDDMLFMNTAAFNGGTGISLDGGAGSGDTLAFNELGTVDAARVNATTGFEVLESAGGMTGFDASDFNFDTFLFSGTNNGKMVIAGVTSADTFIFESDISGPPDEVIAFEGATAGQTLNLELRAQEGAGGEVVIEGSPDAIGFDNNNITSVQITSSGTNANANVIFSGNENNAFFNGFGGPVNFVLTGSQALTIGAVEGESLRANDGTGFRVGTNVDGSSATGNLRLAGSEDDDALIGGSGNDIIYGLRGTDVLTGNAGADQFRLADLTKTGRTVDTITDFVVGEDKIGIASDEGMFLTTVASADGTTVAAADYVDNLQFISNISGADDQKLIELQGSASQDQITQGVAAGSADALVLVFNSTSGRAELWLDGDWSDTAGRFMQADFSNINDLASVVGMSNNDFVEFVF